ncbi:hypothetical protein B0T16DRAFT_443797 [Cercophora newfieldiana]|uniref:Uncharacterized protein n=1 Tax=Cercophora newfieldiana TaxID=92897 RepID=A0AA40CVX0_9PEZI|nr:hypothetical protein B0T16DRAFT_443797 [Cercophora newfieldiana]
MSLINITELTECVGLSRDPPLARFDHQQCYDRYNRCFYNKTDFNNSFSGYIPLQDCNRNCGSHEWYSTKGFIDHVHWLLPVILLASNFQLPPLGVKVKAFALFHLLGDPIDSILSLKHTLQAKYQCTTWAEETLNRGIVAGISVSDLAELSFALDNLQARSSPQLRSSLVELFRDTALQAPAEIPTLQNALQVAGEDLRSTKVTLALPAIVTILIFIANIINELIDSATPSARTASKKPPGNRITFTMLFSWMLPTVLLSAACHRYCEANSSWRAIERFLVSVSKSPEDIGLDAGTCGAGFPTDRSQALESAPYSGTIHSFRPEKMHLRWMLSREEWKGRKSRRRRERRRSFQQRGVVHATKEWVWHEMRYWLPTGLALLPTLLAFGLAMGISYITPTGEFSMRCVVQLSVLLAWLLSYSITTCLGNLWLLGSASGEPPEHRKAMRVFWIIGRKDALFALGTLLAVLLVNGEMLNSCFGWSNGWSGMVTGNQYVSLKWDDKLQDNVSKHYPALESIRHYEMAESLSGAPLRAFEGLDAAPRQDLDMSAAEDLAAIRALLLAIARHNLIEIPKEANSLATSRSTGDVDPRGSLYNESKIIQYRTRQPRTATELPSKENLPPGVSSGLLWASETPRHDRHVDYGSAQDAPQPGNRSYMPPRQEIREHIFKRPDGHELSPPWSKQHFAKEWNLGLHGVGDEEVSSLVVSQLCSHANETEAAPENGHELFPPRLRLVTSFLNQFEGKWGLNRHSWGSSDDKGSSEDDTWGGGAMALTKSRREDVFFQYHMRVFTARSGLRRNCPGRVSGNLTVPSDTRRNVDIHEIRFSVGLKTTWEFDLSVFTLVTMTNSFTGLEDLGELHDTNIWKAVNIRPSIRATGVAAFSFRIRSLLPRWADQWSRLLDQIDRVLSADLANILLPESRREIMVDGSDLRLSEFYLAVLQILRIAADWIQESMDDLRWMVDDMQRLYFSPNTHADSYATFLPSGLEAKKQDASIAIFKQNWDSVKSHQQRLGKALLTRISRKQEEVESLKDGMFNATTVNEAKKSTQLNHYILVFTVVTIIYLPLSFISLFSWEDPRQVKTFHFATTITLVATGTYAFSGFLIWFTQRTTNVSTDLKALVGWFWHGVLGA